MTGPWRPMSEAPPHQAILGYSPAHGQLVIISYGNDESGEMMWELSIGSDDIFPICWKELSIDPYEDYWTTPNV